MTGAASNMKASRITIKKFVEAKQLSEETMAYTASVYFDGRKVGEARNRGNGGSTLVTPVDVTSNSNYAGFDSAVAYAKENALVIGGGPGATAGEFMTEALDEYVDVLASWAAEEKDLKQLLSRKVVFFAANELRTTKAKPSIGQVRMAHPDAVILNELAFSEALAIYRQHAV